MKISTIIGIILLICFIYLLVFSMCKIASNVDKQMEKALEERKQKEQNKKE